MSSPLSVSVPPTHLSVSLLRTGGTPAKPPPGGTPLNESYVKRHELSRSCYVFGSFYRSASELSFRSMCLLTRLIERLFDQLEFVCQQHLLSCMTHFTSYIMVPLKQDFLLNESCVLNEPQTFVLSYCIKEAGLESG